MKKSKKTVKPGGSTSSPATSKVWPKVKISERLLRQILLLAKGERKVIGEAITKAQQAWGEPHLHGGIGIRRLRKNVFECRAGLDSRLLFVFVVTPPELVFFAMGNHDEIRALIRSL